MIRKTLLALLLAFSPLVAQGKAQSVKSITLKVDSASLTVGSSTKASVVERTANGQFAGKPVTWTVTDTSVAKVTVNSTLIATITAKKKGTVSVIAQVQSLSQSQVIQVLAAPIKDTVIVVVDSTPTPTPTPSPTPTTDTTQTVLVSHNFDDGTLGPLINPWDKDIDVIADPTVSNHGKVARYHYAGSAQDVNRGLTPTGITVGLGRSLRFEGDLFFPTPLAGSEPAQRKILYWQRALYPNGHHYPMYENEYFPTFWSVVTTFNYRLMVSNGYGGNEQYDYPDFGFATNRWYKLRYEITLNSSSTAKDGSVRLWVDGVKVYERTGLTWSDPTWTVDFADQMFATFEAGDQVNYSGTFDEYRYWDNIVFTKIP